MYLARLLNSKLREAAKRGNKLALAVTGEKPRSPHWRSVEKAWVAAHGKCAACGGTTQLQVHHVRPFHLFPQLELADGTGKYCELVDHRTGKYVSNLITLCMSRNKEDHLLIGHGGDFHHDNPRVEDDAAELLANPHRRHFIVAISRLHARA